MSEAQLLIIGSFQRFFNTVVRPRLSNTIIDTEWSYFLTLMHKFHTEKERVEMYLKILQSEERTKMQQQQQTRPPLTTLNHFSYLNRQHKMEVCRTGEYDNKENCNEADQKQEPMGFPIDKYEKYRSISSKVHRNQSMFENGTNINQSQAISTKRVPQFGKLDQRLYETVELKLQKRVSLPTNVTTRPLSRDRYQAIYARLLPSVENLLKTFEDVQTSL